MPRSRSDGGKGSTRKPAGGSASGDQSAGAGAGHAAGGEALPSFESAAERLAAIVQELETGELSLEKSLKLFEEGVQVARRAQRRLDEAEQRVEELLGIDERGEPRTREMEP